MDIAGLCLPLKPQKDFNNPVSQVVQHIGTAFTDAKTLYDMIGHTGVTSHITVNQWIQRGRGIGWDIGLRTGIAGRDETVV
jgi:hypothetical protein